jgi:signal peptidase I
VGSTRAGGLGLIRIMGLLLVLTGAFYLSTGLRGIPATYTMEGRSMDPSVGRGDWFLVRPAPMHLARGRLVLMAFRDQGDEHQVLRRLAGIGGDTLLMAGGHLLVNGEEQPWPHRIIEPGAERSLAGPVSGTIYSWGPVVVGPDSVFVLSDVRDMLGWPDSRFLGPIPRSLIEAEYLLTLWRGGQ